jgi:hypothetical protein
VNPNAFKIIDGKLYLSWSKQGSEKFVTEAEKAIKLADENWAELNKQK